MQLWCGIVSLFPEMFRAISDFGISSRAIAEGMVALNYWNPRDFTEDPTRRVDDRPYGGGPGMVMQVAPLRGAIQAAQKAAPGPARVIYLSPQGIPLKQEFLKQRALSGQPLIFVSGRYEGVDERLLALVVDEEWSLGDYVLSGGELATMVVIDAMMRWIPGALGHGASATQDSFTEGLLDCPHYTRPETIAGLRVPEVLLGGDHAAIARWRLKQQLGRTFLRRPDLLAGELSAEQRLLLTEFLSETSGIQSVG